MAVSSALKLPDWNSLHTSPAYLAMDPLSLKEWIFPSSERMPAANTGPMPGIDCKAV